MYSSTVAAGDNIIASQYNNIRKDTFKLGTITMYGGSDTPNGWLTCNGDAVSRTTYSILFSLIGTTYGVGDGSTTFNIPDMRDSFPIGVKTSTFDIGDTGGSSTIVLTTTELPSHTHTISAVGDHTHTLETYTAGSGGGRVFAYTSRTTGFVTFGTSVEPDHTHGGTGNSGEISPTAVNILPPYTSLNFLILADLSADVAQDDTFLTLHLNNVRDESGIEGVVTLFGDASMPTGWLLCDGSAISRATYSDLFSTLGITFGVGDGSTTFNLPDLSDKFVIGTSSTYALGATDNEVKTLVAGNVPQHSHSISDDGDHQHRFLRDDGGGAISVPRSELIDSTISTVNNTSGAGEHDHGGSAGSEGASSTFLPLPKYLALAYIIKH